MAAPEMGSIWLGFSQLGTVEFDEAEKTTVCSGLASVLVVKVFDKKVISSEQYAGADTSAVIAYKDGRGAQILHPNFRHPLAENCLKGLDLKKEKAAYGILKDFSQQLIKEVGDKYLVFPA